MSKVLITGGTGFIGRHCLPLLAAKNYEIHAVSRNRGPLPPLGKLSWHRADLLQPGCVTQLIRDLCPDCLLHLAWCAVPGKFWETPENIQWLRTSLELLSAFAESGGKRVVAAGSCAEYGADTGECVENRTPRAPLTLYGTCKRAFSEVLSCPAYQRMLSSACGRVFFLYGPHEAPSRAVAYVIQSLLRGEPAICSEGCDVLDFMHVEDVASALVALLESDVQGPVNIASGLPIALREVLQEIGRQIGRPELVRLGESARNSQGFRLWANTKRLSSEVGWSPRYDLSRGIAHTIEWWRNQQSVAGKRV